ncbi:hypothetical protein OG244_31420 [Streptomyces brevispora]|uniref:hypothetical protein n=1 Tax=Streptomyces brevispora TaxID=887462 RepID=UPI002E36872A|nr:hypothetical protein [Streptomyces brevispora]
MVSTPAPVRIETDPEHGGRWTSLRAAGREWLWHRPEPRRPGVRPGDSFADAGGLEECVPTVRGVPDHGDAWARPWQRVSDGTESVDCPDFRLSRRIRADADRTVADYRLTAEPGYRFLWAAHALLDLAPGARIEIADGAPVRRYPDGGDRWTPCVWPSGLDRIGPDDGTAVGAIADTRQVSVHDGTAVLRLAVEAEDQPVSVALWRNLGGFPEHDPYRSVGVEPMLGRVFGLAAAGEGDAAVVPAGGEARWRLTVTARTTTAVQN